jgi:hypothetical protein
MSPECTKNAGLARRTASYVRRPPQSGLIPKPWPQVSPDHANVTDVPAIAGGVAKRPVTSSLSPRPSTNFTR